MSLGKTAEALIKLADDMDVEAAKVARFVCPLCSHSASLETINGKRQASVEAAKKAGLIVEANKITINDKIACPACEGVMEYRPTEASNLFFFEKKEAEEKPEEKKEEKKEEAPAEDKKEEVVKEEPKKEVEASKPIDYDSK